MFAFRIRTAAVAVAASIGLSACMTPYGSGVSLGYGSGYNGYGGYGYPGYAAGYGYGYEPYWGWHDGYYYPGSGYYVYDRYRRAYPWDRYQDYWEDRRDRAMSSSEFRRMMEEQRIASDQQNWSGFDKASSQQVQRVRRSDSRAARIERANRAARSDRSTTRSSRSGSERQSASDFRRSQEANKND